MRLFHSILTLTSFLGLGVTAATLRIYTEVESKTPLTIVTLRSDWTLERMSKEEYGKYYEHITIPKGGSTMFEVSGVMEWNSDWCDGKRAFWVTDRENPLGPDEVVRGWQKVSI